jgi:hypothetical protein
MSDVYSMSLDSRTKRELEEMVKDREKEIEYIKGFIKEKDNLSQASLELKEKIDSLLSNNKKPYILIKDNHDRKFAILKTEKAIVAISKNYQGDESISIRCPTGGADIVYDMYNHSRLWVSEKDYIYSIDIKLCETLVEDITNGFCDNEEIRSMLIDGLNSEIKHTYNERKKKLNDTFPLHYHSFLTVTDTDGPKELK